MKENTIIIQVKSDNEKGIKRKNQNETIQKASEDTEIKAIFSKRCRFCNGFENNKRKPGT